MKRLCLLLSLVGLLGLCGSAGAEDLNLVAGGELIVGSQVTVNGNAAFATGSTFKPKIESAVAVTGYGQILVNGTVNLGGATLTLVGSYAPVTGETFTIIDNDGTDAVVGTFDGLAEGASLPALNGTALTISYVGGTGNDVVLQAGVAVPIFPEIAIEQPLLTDVSSGSSKGFGSVNIGGTVDLTFTIKNAGTGNLTLTGTPKVAVSGSHASLFTVSPAPASPVTMGGLTNFTVTFAPLSVGVKTALLTIANNDADEGTFTIQVTGTCTNAVPIDSPLDDVVTGGTAPGEDGSSSVGEFGVLRRGGYLAENGYLVFPGSLEVGTGTPPVTVETSSGLWKTGAGNLSLLARSGTVVPDVAGAQFDVLPETPGINDSGEVSFLGTLIIGTGGVTVDDDTGLWSEIGGSGLKLLMREDDDVPGLAGVKVKQFVSGLFATAHTGATTGEAAYSVTYKGASTKTALLRASVSGATTTISVVAQEGEAAPGTSVNFANLAGSYTDPGRMDALGNFVFSALTTPGSKDGIWYQAVGGATELAVFRGDVAPGTSGATFSKIYRPSMGSAGVFAFRAAVANNTGDNTGNVRNDGIWRGSVAGGFNCILRRGDGVSVVSNLPGVSLVGNVWGGWLTNTNRGAWRAWLDVNGNTVSSAADGDVNAIFADLSGTMQLAVKAGDAAPETSGATFSGFDLPVVGGNDQYAFLGSLTGGDTTADNNQGLWKSAANGGALSLVIRKGDAMTTTEGVKTVQQVDLPGSNSTDRRWEQWVMDGTGRIVVYITFTDGSTTQVVAP